MDRGSVEGSVELVEATASLSVAFWHDGFENVVTITGRDPEGSMTTASLPFREHFRGEAAVLADEVSRTGGVTLEGMLDGSRPFIAHSARSGPASLGPSHDRFHMARFLARGIGAAMGRTGDEVERRAVAQHLSDRSRGR